MVEITGKVTVSKISKPVEADVYVRIDRLSIFGNPFRIDDENNREKVIKDYEEWFHHQVTTNYRFRDEVIRIITMVYHGQNVSLLCHCAPLPCHGDVIKDYVMSQFN